MVHCSTYCRVYVHSGADAMYVFFFALEVCSWTQMSKNSFFTLPSNLPHPSFTHSSLW